jgi:hypothetical protein
MAVWSKTSFFWDVTPCHWVIWLRRFEVTYCLFPRVALYKLFHCTSVSTNSLTFVSVSAGPLSVNRRCLYHIHSSLLYWISEFSDCVRYFLNMMIVPNVDCVVRQQCPGLAWLHPQSSRQFAWQISAWVPQTIRSAYVSHIIATTT